MLKKLTKITSVLLILALIFSFNFVFAENEDTEIMPISEEGENVENTVTESIENAQNNMKNNDIYLMEDNITIDYTVDGNVFLMGNTVTINSEIGGDAFIIAKELIIGEKGSIYSNLFAISTKIKIEGLVYNAYTLSETLDINNGYIYKDLKFAGNTLNVNGVIGRNVNTTFQNINFNENGVIYGNLEYNATSEIELPENAVAGEVKFTQTKEMTKKPIKDIISESILDAITFIIFVLGIWFICSWITPKFLNNTNNFVGKTSFKVLGIGFISLVIIPIACIILILLRLTSTLSLLFITLYILSIILTKTLFTITANNYLCSKIKIDKKPQVLGMLILSSIVIWAISKLPYIGGIIGFIACIFGLGILVLSILPKSKKANKDNK